MIIFSISGKYGTNSLSIIKAIIYSFSCYNKDNNNSCYNKDNNNNDNKKELIMIKTISNNYPPCTHNGFTLAETLITLVIIGIVAALTVPTLIAKNAEEQTITSVKKFYSEISQAYNTAIAENGPPETWDWAYTGEGSERIMDIFAPYLRIMKRCGAGGAIDKCFGTTRYKTLNTNVNWIFQPSTDSIYSTARLDNGFIFWIWSHSPCTTNYGSEKLRNVCGAVGVDINGYKKPNALGRDTFYFWITKTGIVPMGTKLDTKYPLATYCNKTLTNGTNGYACSSWIISNGNMDYLHKNISW